MNFTEFRTASRCPGAITVAAILFIFSCGSPPAPEEIVLPDGTEKISFSGRILSPPALFRNRPFRLRFRAYYCPQTAGDANSAETAEPVKPQNDPMRRCQLKYHEKIVDADGDFEQELAVNPGWTHAFVELLDTDEISGKYSPGPNPFWFRPAQQTVELRHDFDFESQENPIPDSRQKALAEKFAPIIVIAAGKKYPPSNLEKFAGKFKTESYARKPGALNDTNRIDPDASNYIVLPEDLQGKGATHLYYHVRFADTLVSGAQPEALPGWRDNANYRYRAGNGDVVISYWIWYDVNEGPTSFGNFHQGDLESFAVLADASDRPLRFMVTGHDYIMLDTSWNNINSLNNHPIVYIASGNKGADGGNPTSAYGGFEVSLDAGNSLFNWISDPRDIFPTPVENSSIIIPADMKTEQLSSVRLGPGERLGITEYRNLKEKVIGRIEKLVAWDEPGWINLPSDRDPDGHHRVDPNIAWFLTFNGRVGMHPRSKMNWFNLTRYGESPENAPFKSNIEQHYTFERPRMDRFYTGRIGDYSPKFQGDSNTPQFLQ